MSGLGTGTFTAAAAGALQIDVYSTMVPPSGLSVVINQNGSPIYTSPTPTAVDQTVRISTVAQVAVSDVITVVLSSTNLNDAPPNNIKTSVNLHMV